MSSVKLPVFKIIRPGIFCAVQDFGRFGFRHLGVPCSGVSDRQSMIYANFLVNNRPDKPVLEVFGQKCEIEILNPVNIAVSGATAQLLLDGIISDFSVARCVVPGQKLKIEKLINGAISYIAVSGGFEAEPVMGSVSTLTGTHLRPLLKNEVVFAAISEDLPSKNLGHLKPLNIDINSQINVQKGPEFDMLDENSKIRLFEDVYRITKNSNRMGYRLDGNPLQRINLNDILTSAVAPGVVQLLPDGQLILLMRDCQTTGGYPRILICGESDINQIAHRSPGDTIRFKLQ